MKKIISMITSIALTLALIPVFSLTGYAESFIENGIEFSTSKDNASIWGVEEDVIDLVVPEHINGYKIDRINLSEEENLKSITIPADFTDIIQISIDKCSALENIYVDENNEFFCSVDGVLYSKDMKTLYFYPPGKPESNYTVPNGVEVIYGNFELYTYAFGYCTNLKEIILPETLTKIEECAFAYCSFETIKLPESLITIGNSAFSLNLNLKEITIPEKTRNVLYPFYGCDNLKKIIFLDHEMTPFLLSSFPKDEHDLYYLHIFDECYFSADIYVPDNKLNEYTEISEFWDLTDFNIYTLSQLPDEIISGDVNYDQTLSTADVVMMQKSFAKSDGMKLMKAADMNGDGKLNVFDLILLKRKIQNL